MFGRRLPEREVGLAKLPDLPKAALDDVQVTPLQPVGVENEWGDPRLVTFNVMASLQTVKQITIDEKIAFWQRVMRHARNRGIDVYWITWNIPEQRGATGGAIGGTGMRSGPWKRVPRGHGIRRQSESWTAVDYESAAVCRRWRQRRGAPGAGTTPKRFTRRPSSLSTRKRGQGSQLARKTHVKPKTRAAGRQAERFGYGGRHGTRTHDPGVANAVLSQLS